MFSRIGLVLMSFIVVFSPLSLQAQALNIDLGNVYGTPSDNYGAASGQTGRWNTVTQVSYTYDLLDTSGVPTSADMTISAGNVGGWADVCAVADAKALVSDNFWANSYWKIVVLSLTNGTYDLFLYAPSNAGVVTGNLNINGAPIASITGDDCGLDEGAGWTRVTIEVPGGSFWMTGTGAGTVGLAGIQLIPRIFTDGFESGDTLAWDVSVP